MKGSQTPEDALQSLQGILRGIDVPDLRKAPQEPTWLELRQLQDPVLILRHACCRVESTDEYPTSALCLFPSGRIGEVYYWDMACPGAQWPKFYGHEQFWTQSKRLTSKATEITGRSGNRWMRHNRVGARK